MYLYLPIKQNNQKTNIVRYNIFLTTAAVRFCCYVAEFTMNIAMYSFAVLLLAVHGVIGNDYYDQQRTEISKFAVNEISKRLGYLKYLDTRSIESEVSSNMLQA